MSHTVRVRGSQFVVTMCLLVLVSSPVLAQGKKSGKKPSAEALDKAALRGMQKVQRKYCIDLSKLAATMARKGLIVEARAVEQKIRQIDPENPNLRKLAKRILDAEEETDPTALEKARKYATKRREQIDQDQGKRLYKLASACMRFGLFTKTHDMLSSILEISPDDKKARTALGWRRDKKSKEWVSKWEYDMRKKSFLTPEGWFPKKKKRDFDKGLRPYQGKWIPKEREKEVRMRSSLGAYSVDSEHFRIKTNMGREKAWEIAQLLEDFYGEFFRTFIGYYDQVAGAKLLFNTPDAKLKHTVILYPDRKKYLIDVKRSKGNDELLVHSAGFYSSGDRVSRFYWSGNEENTLSTLYHEVGHQLFAETKDTARGGSEGNNWVVEGIATYIESWIKKDGRWIPGGNLDESSLVQAEAVLGAQEDWDLAGFAAIGHKEFHGEAGTDSAHRGQNYAMAGALCHFFMHYDDEIYKEDFVRFLSDYYGGKVRKNSLGASIRDESGRTIPFSELQEQFRHYILNRKAIWAGESSATVAEGASTTEAPEETEGASK